MTEPANNRHTCSSANWGTPLWIIQAAKKVLGGHIDLDPASSKRSNKIVGADRYFTRREDGLKRAWLTNPQMQHMAIFLNPPGGWHNGVVGDSEIKHWWKKLLEEREQDYFGHALFLAFSVEAQQTTQVGCDTDVLAFASCAFNRRVGYIDPQTSCKVQGNTHSSSIHYLPGRYNEAQLFHDTFKQFGRITIPWEWESYELIP